MNLFFLSMDSDWIYILIFVVGVWLFLGGLFLYLKSKKKKTVRVLSHSGKRVLSNKKLAEFMPNFDREKFSKDAFLSFVNLQEAANNYDIEELRRRLGSNLFREYNDIMTRNQNMGNSMFRNEFAYFYSDIIGVARERGEIFVNLLMGVEFKEYYLNSNNEVIRGSMTVPTYREFNLVYIVRNNTRAILSCPHCGALVNSRTISNCSICQKPLISYDYQLTLVGEKSRGIRKPKTFVD